MKRRTRRRLYVVAFFFPILTITAFFVYGFFVNVQKGSGVLIVEAQATYANDSRFIHVAATVNGITKTTPFNVTLSPGVYTVTYSDLNGYYHPESRAIPVPGGTNSWSVGVFKPIPVNVGIANTGFNQTSVRAGTNTTPVVWINHGSQAVQIESSLFNAVILPGDSYYYIFGSAGSYTVSILGTGETMVVKVS